MFISNRHKFIFIHIMKAAGESMTQELDKTLSWNNLVVGGTEFGEQVQSFYKERFNLWKHSPAIEVKEVVGSKIWSDYFTRL